MSRLLLEEPLNVTWRSAPFTGQICRMSLPQGLSCAEIIGRVENLNLRAFLQEGVFCINGESVPREMWPFVRPKARSDLIVTLHMPIRGGGGSGGGGGAKDALRIVAAIALVVISAVTVPFLTPIIGSIGAQIVAAGITIAGSLLLGAFVKPPAAKVDQKDPTREEPGTASLQGNVLRRGEPIPRVVGTHRVFPPFLAQPLIDLDDDYHEVVEAVYGLAGPHHIREIKFGDVFADEIDPDQLTYQFEELSDEDNGIDDDVQFMMHFNGEQDSVAFVDSSFNDRSFTATGSVFLDKGIDWFGLTAAYFGGSGSFLSTSSVPEFAPLTEDFSFDTFFEWDTVAGLEGNIAGFTDSALTAAGSAWRMYMNSSNRLSFSVSDGSAFTTITGTSNIAQGRHHAAGARIGDMLYLWVDGVLQASGAFTGSVPGSLVTFNIGSRGNDVLTNTWQGWIDEARYKVGSVDFEAGVNFSLRRSEYRPEQLTLITRYGKTGTPNITMSRHRITNETATQGTRDTLSNQLIPQRSLPQSQSVIARGTDLDEIWVTLTFPGGLYYTDDGFADTLFYSVPFRIRIRALGTQEWFNLPEVHVSDRRTALFSRMLVFRWDTDTEMPNGTPNVEPLLQKAWRVAYSTVPVQAVSPAGIGGWTADSHFYAGSGDTYMTQENFASTGLVNMRMLTERVEFFLDGLVERGPLEIEIRRGQIYVADEFTYSSYSLNTDPPADALANGVYDFFGYATLGAEQVVILKQSNASDQVVIARVSSVWNSPPITRRGEFASVQVIATGRTLDAMSCMASGLVPDWDGTEWSGQHATSNPAPHFRDVLTGDLNDNSIPEDLVDDDVLVEWRQRCLDLEFECNAVFAGENVDRVLEVIASCGYARPRQSEVWDVAQDRDFTNIVPAQVFTPRNMRGFRWEKAFIRHRPDGLRVRFSDASDSYIEKTVVVPRLGVASANAGRLEEIRYDGLVTVPEVVFKAVYDQQQVIDRFTFYYAEADVESLVCRRGDLVVVQHDILDQFAGFSRVLEADIQDGVLTSFELDGSVSPIDAFFLTTPSFFMEPTDFFTDDVGVSVRQKDGTVLTFQAAVSDNGFVLTPNPELVDVDPEVFQRECLVTTGRLLRESRRMLVFNIRPRKDLVAELTFVDEAPQLWLFPEPVQVEEAFMRNKIINGDMRLDQRGNGVAHTLTDQTTTYTLDRWFAFNGDSVGATVAFNVQQVDDDPPPAFSHYLRVTIVDDVSPVPADDRYFIGYTLSEDDMGDLDWGQPSGRTVALSFMVRSSVAGTFSGALGSPFDDLCYPFTFSLPVANQWARRIITIPAPPGSPPFAALNGKGLLIRFSLGCGADHTSSLANQWSEDNARGVTGETALVNTLGATLDITGVQFEVAPATTFEWLSLSLQQEMAYRYTQVLRPIGDNMLIGTATAFSTTLARGSVPLPVPLRSIPPVSVAPQASSPLFFDVVRQGGVIEVTSISQQSPDQCSPGMLSLDFNVAAGLTAGEALQVRVNSGGVLIIDAELY